MSQNLPAVPTEHPRPDRTLTPVRPLSEDPDTMAETAAALPDPTEVATPRLRAVTPESIPATVHHAGAMPPEALPLRHQALTRLGITPTTSGVPDPRAWGRRLAQAVSEVLAGDRPISQLVRFTDETVFADLNRRVRVLGMTTTATARGAKERSTVRSIRVCTPAHEIAEVAAHVRHGERSRAIAFRMEIRRNRWVCTALEVG
jgi:hypothetical protein